VTAFAHAPLEPQPRLLTVAEYVALGETVCGYTELLEGRVLMSPSPRPMHNIAAMELLLQIAPQLTQDLVVIQGVDIDLELVPPGDPGFSRRPDLIIVDRAAMHRTADPTEGIIRASEVLVVIEIVSPDSRRTDNVHKRADYAEAGIPRYWMIDLERPVSMLLCDAVGEVEYTDVGRFTGSFEIVDPAPLTLELDRLRSDRAQLR
jgi:Uma2 family endonuclease